MPIRGHVTGEHAQGLHDLAGIFGLGGSELFHHQLEGPAKRLDGNGSRFKVTRDVGEVAGVEGDVLNERCVLPEVGQLLGFPLVRYDVEGQRWREVVAEHARKRVLHLVGIRLPILVLELRQAIEQGVRLATDPKIAKYSPTPKLACEGVPTYPGVC